MGSPEPFVADPDNRDIIRGGPFRARVLRGLRAVFWFLLVLECLALALGAWLARDWMTWHWLRLWGARGEARVTAMRQTVDKDDDRHYYVRYEVLVADKLLENSAREQKVWARSYEKLNIGGTLPAYYHPRSPAVSRLVADDPERSQAFSSLLFLVPLACVLLWFVLVQARYVRRVRDGRILEGKMLGARHIPGEEGPEKASFSYTFCSPTGRVLRGEETVTASTPWFGGPHLALYVPFPALDLPVAVLHFDDNNYPML